jgi:phage shock protein C
MLLDKKNNDMKSSNAANSSQTPPPAGDPYAPPPMGQPASGPGYYNPHPYRKLYRSTSDKWIAGVCGGIAEYYHMDPVMVRLLWIVVTIFSMGAGIIGYILFWIFVKKYPAFYISPVVTTSSGSGKVHYHYHGRASP